MAGNIDEFVHLHIHTEYSLPEAVCRLEELMERAKSWNMTSLAITDIEAVHGAIRFCELAEKYGIHPIIGCEMEVGEKGERLILLAATNKGFERIVQGLNRGSFGPPDTNGDIVALSRGRSGIIHRLLADGQPERAEVKALEYAEWFGKDNFYIEIQDHGFAEDRAIIERTVQLSAKTGIPLVATHDVHYLDPEDAALVHMLQNRPFHQQPSRGPFYLPSPLEMKRKFHDLPDALANTVRIARRCRFRFEPGEHRLPKLPVPERWTENTYLQKLCQDGLRYRLKIGERSVPERKRIIDRMNRELSVITSRSLASYFLVVWDIVQFARTNGIPLGPGRGSAAGSLVAYLLGITDINPLNYDLSFERFLSPDRPDLPDIDLDVCQRRRHEIIRYIKDKYGSNRVAHIGVVNTFGTRGAVREAGAYLQLPDEQINLLAKLLPAFSGQGGIRHCLQTLPELQKLPLDKEPFKSLFRLAERIEGLPRNVSSHPSGILIGHDDLAGTIPLMTRPDGDLTTTFNKEDIQALGLLKIDLLGLRNLTVIHDTLQAVFRLTGKQLNNERIPLDDAATFRTIANGDTVGCFQLESMGIRALMRRMKPQNLEDLTALLALYRPGAWQDGIVETYVRRRSGAEKSTVLLPDMEPILAPTYGLILYQEQVMQIAHVVAGYSMGEADALRRALAKKSTEALTYHRNRFVRKAIERGRSSKDACAAFDFLARFAGYSFNKAHSVSYATISYWTAYLKTHYPKEYMAALLSSEGGYYDRSVYIREAIRMGIPLLGPDVNRSGVGFQAEREGIRVGMDRIKGCGPEAVSALLQSRKMDGDFADFQDFFTRMKACRVKSSVLKAWIAAGACDGLCGNRRKMLEVLDSPKEIVMDSPLQVTLFDAVPPDAPDFSECEKRKMEKALLGFSLDPAPSAKWQQFLDRYHIVPIEALQKRHTHSRVRIAGKIVHSRRQPTGRGEYLLTLVLQDHSGMIEVVLYPKTYKSCLYQLNPEGIIVEGFLRTQDMSTQVVAEKMKALGG